MLHPENARAPVGPGALKRGPSKNQASARSVADHGGADEVRPRLFRTAEAHAYLGIGARTLWTLTNSGQIPHVRIGRSVRYDLGDLDAWIAAHKQGGRS